ncbi:tRNA pseudouridine(13) synthase TruD [Halobaculum sp. MBLA0147]|uniref:tRNA pseudouridine(13) synthase TruD n=1 Tax=Halobaculum sp. MBLA0147 TaxID=3079934 RepID=UPI0035238EE0
MREAHEREQTVGIDWYVVDAPGVGGRLRSRHGDFRVRELETVSPVTTDADPGSYPHLLVRARLVGWDTNDFVRRLSTAMGIGRERISWAGTKDKRAVTTQLFSIRDATPADLPSVDDAEVTVVGRLGRDLTFGDLAGNAFEIRVRDTGPRGEDGGKSDQTDGTGAAESDADDPVAALVDDLATWWRDESSGDGGGAREDSPVPGTARITDPNARVDENVPPDAARRAVAVPNWFGHQRFGSRRPVTHEVGLRLAAGDPRGAVLTYVGNPAPTEPTETRAARAAVDREATREDPNWSGTLAWYPDRLRFERSMLHRLADESRTDDSGDAIAGGEGDDAGDTDTGTDTDTAVDTEWLDHERVAPADRRWWDAVAAVPENLQRLFVNAAQSSLFNRIVSERLRRGLPLHRPVEGDVVCFRDGDDERVARPDPDRTQRATADRVDVLTRHCERGRAFVTTPLVGHETELAEGEPGEIEREVLAEAGVEPADFALPGAFDSAGTRRALLVGTELAVERVDEDPVFAFALPSGAYATALLREVLQRDPTAL